MDVDVLVIGGGPAGAYLANYLGKHGSGDVLLVDKRRIMYSPVICGELVPSEELLRGWITPELYGVLVETLRVTINGEFIVNKLSKVRLIIGDADVTLDFPTYLVDKGAMLANLLGEASELGVKVKFGVQVIKCHRVSGRYECLVHDKDGGEYVIRSRILVGADAYPSIVDEDLGISNGFNPEDLIIATDSRAAGNYGDDEAVVIMDPEIAPGGYSWIFPRGDGTHNVGTGVRSSIAWSGVDPLRVHEAFISKFELKQTQRGVFMKTIPVGGLLNRYEAGNAYLVGDAVGSVIPTNGAGINPAMITAHILGRSLTRGESYTDNMNSLLKPLQDRMLFFRRTGDPLLMNPRAMRMAVKLSKRFMATSIYEAMLSSMRRRSLLYFLVGYPLIRLLDLSSRIT